jgi:polyvinyl alcohol dehydrogenase (cytochrome)
MNSYISLARTAILCGWLSASSIVFADITASGEQIFQDNCVICHNGEHPKAPGVSALETLNSRFVLDALTTGKMRMQGASLSDKDKEILVSWLGRKIQSSAPWEESAMCGNTTTNLAGENYAPHWGLDSRNGRYQAKTSINAANASTLRKKWVMAFPGAAVMRSQPAVVGDTLFLALADLYKVYAIDRKVGCLKWVYEAENPPRSAVSAGKLSDGRDVVFYGDMAGFVHVLDATTGKPVWAKSVAAKEINLITGPITLFDNTLFVPQSSIETLYASNPEYECCQTQGALTAVNAMTGEVIWEAFPLPEAKPQGRNRVGTMNYGPAGASMWNAPLIDQKRGHIVVGTGPISSGPDTGTGDAIIAFDLKTGEMKWSFQGTKNDFWNSACRSQYDDGSHPNCPQVGWDLDFGAGVILAQKSNGEDILIAGQKSGAVYGLDPDNGTLIWRKRLSEGSVLGGVHWGMAATGSHVYVPISDPSLKIADIKVSAIIAQRMKNYHPKPGLYKLSVDTGDIVWAREYTRTCEPDHSSDDVWPVCPREIGLSAAPVLVEGAIIVAGLEGAVRIYATDDARLLYEDQTAVAFDETVNGVTGHGGTIDNAVMMVADDMLYVQSGYASFGGMPGNVLIAYKLTVGEKEQRTK